LKKNDGRKNKKRGDGGKNAFPELARVLKPDGCLLGTGWVAEHIFKMKDLEMAEKYFNKIEVYYFHLISWLAFPFLKMHGGKFFLKMMETTDNILFLIPLLRKYAFKIVFVFSNPKK